MHTQLELGKRDHGHRSFVRQPIDGEFASLRACDEDRRIEYAGGWMRQIVAASGHDAELVTVPDDAVPDDLALSRSQPQHMLADTRKATEVLGWQPADAAASIERSVRWHRRHPPPDPSPDFAADDRALAR